MYQWHSEHVKHFITASFYNDPAAAETCGMTGIAQSLYGYVGFVLCTFGSVAKVYEAEELRKKRVQRL